MCRCDEGPARDRFADAAAQVEAEQQIAEAKATAPCEGCTIVAPLTPGMVVRREAPQDTPQPVRLCDVCWDAVDGADPVTGAYGASAVSLMRAPEPAPRPGAHAQLAAVALVGINRVMAACDRRVMETPSWEEPDTRTRDEKARDAAMVNRAMAEAARLVCPDAHALRLQSLTFAVGVLMERAFQGHPECATEAEQYGVLYTAKRTQLGRPPWPDERDRLHWASEQLWQAVHDPSLPSGEPLVDRLARVA